MLSEIEISIKMYEIFWRDNKFNAIEFGFVKEAYIDCCALLNVKHISKMDINVDRILDVLSNLVSAIILHQIQMSEEDNVHIVDRKN